MEIELSSVFDKIRLHENMKECYQVKLYYLNSKSSGLEECEMNELRLQKLLLIKEIETLTYKLAYLYVEYDKLHNAIIEHKTNISMQNGESNTRPD